MRLVVAALCLAAASAVPAVPALFWSDGLQIGDKSYTSDVLGSADILSYLRSVVSPGGAPADAAGSPAADAKTAASSPTPPALPLALQLDAAASPPEVLLGFIFDHLRTDELSHMAGAYGASPSGGSFSALKAAIEGANSSLVAPFTVRGAPQASGHGFFDDLARTFEDNLAVLARSVAGAGSSSVAGSAPASAASAASAVTPEELLATLQQSGNAHLFGNGRPDVVLVQLETQGGAGGGERGRAAVAKADKLLGDVTRLVASSTGGNYMAFVTAERGSELPLPLPAAATHRRGRALLAEAPAAGAAGAAGSDAKVYGPVRMTPVILTGIVIGFFLFCVLLVGVCCMLSIPSTYVMLSDPPEQDPSHPQGIKFYPYKNLPIKEY